MSQRDHDTSPELPQNNRSRAGSRSSVEPMPFQEFIKHTPPITQGFFPGLEGAGPSRKDKTDEIISREEYSPRDDDSPSIPLRGLEISRGKSQDTASKPTRAFKPPRLLIESPSSSDSERMPFARKSTNNKSEGGVTARREAKINVSDPKPGSYAKLPTTAPAASPPQDLEEFRRTTPSTTKAATPAEESRPKLSLRRSMNTLRRRRYDDDAR